MGQIAINKASDAIAIFESTLKDAVKQLDQTDQIAVERLTTLDGYILKHPRGCFGLLYNGSSYEKDPNVKSSAVIMKRNILIGVVSIVRFFDNPNQTLDKFKMIPADYVDFATDNISGIEIFNERPEYERKIIPVKDELVDEEGGIWKYLTTFSVPADFIEKSLREN